MSIPLQISHVLKSLSPTDSEELSLLRFVIACADRLRVAGLEASESDALSVLKELPEDLRRYFHGLMEALDIYQGIHGTSIPTKDLSLTDPSVRELKQIRDMCLEEGLRSIY